MGAWSSKEEPPRPPPPPPLPKLLPYPWRDILDWTNLKKVNADLRCKIKRYIPLKNVSPRDININFLNTIVIGQVGAGKSCFVNSIVSAVLGEVTQVAASGTSDQKSLTKRFTRYEIPPMDDKKPLRLMFSDMRGIDETYTLSRENITLFLLGHIAENTLFEKADAQVDEHTKGYIKSPKFDDRTMCCIIVVDSTQVNTMNKTVTENIKAAQNVMNDLGILQIIVLSKIDQLCKFTQEKVSNAFSSKEVKWCVQQASELFGLPENQVFPVKNYATDQTSNDEMDAILLFTLNEIIKKVEATLNILYRRLDRDSHLRLWRTTIDWGAQFEIADAMKRYFESYSPVRDKTDRQTDTLHANLLLFGPIGAGKSSFVNSVKSVFNGKFDIPAKSGSSQKSETTEYRRYQLELNGNKNLPIRMCDMPGLESDCCITDENANLLLKGHIRENMTFIPNKKVTQYGEGRPDDRIACVIIVINATAINTMSRDVVANIYAFQRVMKSLGVKEVVLLTKVDELFDFRIENVPEIFQNKKVEECVKLVEALFNVPTNYVFPMKNYKDENQMNDALNVLIFQTMKDILRMAESTLYTFNQDAKKPELLPEPWRILHKGSRSEAKSELKTSIEKFRPFKSNKKGLSLNIQVLGPEDSGKSSFINTVFSGLRQKKYQIADVGPVALKKYQRYQLSTDKNEALPITLCDVRGFQGQDGVEQKNLDLLLKGHIVSGTEFDLSKNVFPDDPCHNPDPAPTDRISAVVIVIDAIIAREMPENIKSNIQLILSQIGN